MGFEALEEDEADDKNSGNHDEAQDHQDNTMASDFMIQSHSQNSPIVKILPLPREKQRLPFPLSLSCSPAAKMALAGLQVCS